MTPTESRPETRHESRHESKTRLLDAALHVIRANGYSATRIEDICEAAGLTKGSFFHHFDSKEALALAAADYWIEGTSALFASAPYHAPSDPLDRLLAYVDVIWVMVALTALLVPLPFLMRRPKKDAPVPVGH